MSLINNARAIIGAVTNKPALTSADLAQRRRQAERRLSALESQRDELALAALAGSDAERTALDDHDADIAVERKALVDIAAAIRAAEAREAAEERQRLASLNASRVHSATMHLRSAERAAAELAEVLAKAGEARRKLLAASAKARLSAPSPLPAGSLTEAGVLDKLISGEMHRLSYDRKAGALPGAKPPSLLTKDDPAAIEPLTDQLRQAHDFAIAVLKGELAEPRTPTLPIGENGAPLVDVTSTEKSASPAIAEPPEVDWSNVGPFVPPDTTPRKLSIADDDK
jgi:hypothetical protein